MYRLILISVFTLAAFLNYQQTSHAECTEGPPDTFNCNTNPPNPDLNGVQEGSSSNDIIVNMLPGSAIDTTTDPGADLTGIDLGTGRLTVTVDNAQISAQDYCIENATNNNGGQITLMNAHLTSVTNNCISLNSPVAPYIVDITDSDISTIDDTIIRTGSGDDVYNVRNSEIKVFTAAGNDLAILTTSGDDRVTLENTLLVGGNSTGIVTTAIGLGDDDDILTIGNGVRLRGLRPGGEESFGIINCGNGTDTIIFAMDVPEQRLNRISDEIALADPADDTLIINGLRYSWIDCEILINELNGVQFTRPIPTVSQWGLIAMAGVLGIIGLIAIRRRKAAF